MHYFKDNQAYETANSYALKFQELFGLVLKFDESEDKKVSLILDKSNLRGEYDIDTHVNRMKHYFPPLLQEGIEYCGFVENRNQKNSSSYLPSFII